MADLSDQERTFLVEPAVGLPGVGVDGDDGCGAGLVGGGLVSPAGGWSVGVVAVWGVVLTEGSEALHEVLADVRVTLVWTVAEEVKLVLVELRARAAPTFPGGQVGSRCPPDRVFGYAQMDGGKVVKLVGSGLFSWGRFE